MSNTGIAPADFTSTVGQFRLITGDTAATDVAGGNGTYKFFGDEEILGYLRLSDNVYRAASLGLNALATQAADEARTVKDYDLQVDLRARSKEFREQAEAALRAANLLDAEGFEGFQLVSTGVDLVECIDNFGACGDSVCRCV